MKRNVTIAATIGLAWLAAAPAAWGQTVIHRCDVMGRTLYSDRPCEARSPARFSEPREAAPATRRELPMKKERGSTRQATALA